MSDLRSPPPGNAALLAAHEKARRASLTKANLEKLTAALQKRVAEQDELLAAATGALEPIEVSPIVPAARSGTHPEAAYVMLASDWHPGAIVRSKEVEGRNEFNIDIANARAERFWQSNLKLLQVHRASWNVNQVVLWLGGDLMENWLHEESSTSTSMSPTQETKWMYTELSRGLQFMLDHFDCERIVVVTSNGNHGRNTKRKWATGAFLTSYEFLVYELLQMRFGDRIEFQLGYGYENHYTIHGLRICFHHGDEVQYNGGVGGIYPALYRRINATQNADLHCFGHHHQLGFAPRAIGNGSLVGLTAYAATKGFTPEPPQQASFIVDAKYHVPSGMNPVFVQEPRRGRK